MAAAGGNAVCKPTRKVSKRARIVLVIAPSLISRMRVGLHHIPASQRRNSGRDRAAHGDHEHREGARCMALDGAPRRGRDKTPSAGQSLHSRRVQRISRRPCCRRGPPSQAPDIYRSTNMQGCARHHPPKETARFRTQMVRASAASSVSPGAPMGNADCPCNREKVTYLRCAGPLFRLEDSNH